MISIFKKFLLHGETIKTLTRLSDTLLDTSQIEDKINRYFVLHLLQNFPENNCITACLCTSSCFHSSTSSMRRPMKKSKVSRSEQVKRSCFKVHGTPYSFPTSELGARNFFPGFIIWPIGLQVKVKILTFYCILELLGTNTTSYHKKRTKIPKYRGKTLNYFHNLILDPKYFLPPLDIANVNFVHLCSHPNSKYFSWFAIGVQDSKRLRSKMFSLKRF